MNTERHSLNDKELDEEYRSTVGGLASYVGDPVCMVAGGGPHAIVYASFRARWKSMMRVPPAVWGAILLPSLLPYERFRNLAV